MEQINGIVGNEINSSANSVVECDKVGASISSSQLLQVQLIQQKIEQQLSQQQQQRQIQQQQHQQFLMTMSAQATQQSLMNPPMMLKYPTTYAPISMPTTYPLQVPSYGLVQPPIPPPVVQLDLTRIPVGNMVNIVKAAKRAGHPASSSTNLDDNDNVMQPIDIMIYASHASPYVEPGRLEARVAEFYKHAEAILNPPPPPPPSVNIAKSSFKTESPPRARSNSSLQVATSLLADDERLDTKSFLDKEEGWEKHVPGYEEEREKQQRQQEEQIRSRKYARRSATSGSVPVSTIDTEIAEDNMGHKLLRGLGWQKGSGLGAENAGIVEPIRGETGKTAADRTGLGKNTNNIDSNNGTINFSAYRNQLSSDYHSRIYDREKR